MADESSVETGDMESFGEASKVDNAEKELNKNDEVLNSSKESENIEDIKKFIEEHDVEQPEKNAEENIEKQETGNAIEKKEEQETENNVSDKNEEKSQCEENVGEKDNVTTPEIEPESSTELAAGNEERKDLDTSTTETEHNESEETPEKHKDTDSADETMAVASSVMDMILTDSEARIAKKKVKPLKESINAGEKGNNSVALSVGSKVEAKDFAELWHPAKIMEVDYDEMEVLVHYGDGMKRHDEWISVSSPRLRPLGSKPSTPVPKEPEPEPVQKQPVEPDPPVVKEEPKHEEKSKVKFVAGERCLARWRDNRRFIATVREDLGQGKYEIMFDDGVRWTCPAARLSKLKESRRDSLHVDTNLTCTSSTPSPVYGPGPGGPGTSTTTAALLPAYHTHLFDPARDYLSSKSERREMKRKLNVKELFNIGQKKKKVEKVEASKNRAPPEKTSKAKPETGKPKPKKKKVKTEPVKLELKKEIPDAVASIIGSVLEPTEPTAKVKKEIKEEEIKNETDKGERKEEDCKMEVDEPVDVVTNEIVTATEKKEQDSTQDIKTKEEQKLENFQKADNATTEEVIDRIKEVINKLEDGMKTEFGLKNEAEEPPTAPTEQMVTDVKDEVIQESIPTTQETKPKKKLAKVKKSKKLRLLQEKKVKKQVEKVKCELEEMKKQVEEMRKEMLEKTEALAKAKNQPPKVVTEMPESFLLPGEWCCKWVNGQPVGTVSEIEHDGKPPSDGSKPLPRRSVQVEDKRLPPGWTKHMVRRSFGSSAGKWDVVLVSPSNRRFHTKTDMRLFLAHTSEPELQKYEDVLTDFGVHLKLSRRMGWYTITPDGEQETPQPVQGVLSISSPIVKKKKLNVKDFIKIKKDKKMKIKDFIRKDKKKKRSARDKVPKHYYQMAFDSSLAGTSRDVTVVDPTAPLDVPAEPAPPPLEDGYVYVGSLKVQIIENLLRCPAEGCFKNFRNNTLLKMHIKHYHRELRKSLGATPKVLDLAFARQRPTAMEIAQMRHDAVHKTIRVKIPRLPKKYHPEVKPEQKETPETKPEVPKVTPKTELPEKIPRSLDSPKLRTALHKPVKRPKVLLPVRNPEPTDIKEESDELEPKSEPPMEVLDFETAISTHTVTKPAGEFRKGDKKRKTFATVSKKGTSEDEEWFMNNSDVETRSSGPRSGTPDSKTMDQKMASSEFNEEIKPEPSNYLFTETGERIKIVHMKREEIINCHCGFREEDGLMVQCELCLCWQHALCHNIQKESDVPEKYTCSICLNPRRGRKSARFLHDQDRMYEGLLPGAGAGTGASELRACPALRRTHELAGNLLRIDDALHALRVKYYVATKKDHPKLYLWAKDWETGELTMTQEKLNSDYSDLNIMISNIGKENLPLKEVPLDIRTPPSEELEERFSHKDNQLGSQALLSGLLSSPGGASLDLPISTSELERLAKTVQAEACLARVTAPQPEAAIENGACRERLLRHIQRCQALIDARLDSIEAQVAELESQDPSFEDDETADYFPRTKQTIQMLARDLDTMEELGVIT